MGLRAEEWSQMGSKTGSLQRQGASGKYFNKIIRMYIVEPITN
jgi:hypothetical protein